MLTLNAMMESRCFADTNLSNKSHGIHNVTHAQFSSTGSNTAEWSGDTLVNDGTGNAWWYQPTTVIPTITYPGTYPYPGDITPIQNPYIINPYVQPVTDPFLFLDKDIIILPKEKIERRRALRAELAKLEDDPITDMPKRPHRRIELSDEGEK
jgi:hypothetical protein